MIQTLCIEAQSSPESALETAFSCPTVVHLSSLLNTSEVQALSASNPPLFKLAQIFAYGTVEDLDTEIPATCLHKLRQLSLITYATENRQLSYSDLIRRLKLNSARELEDVVIDSIYNGMVKGRLDSVNQMVMIDDWMARDVLNWENLLPQMSDVLNSWLNHASKTQNAALNKAEQENLKMHDELEQKRKTEAEIQEARQGLEETMNRSHDIGSVPNETTPRTKRRGILGNRVKK